MHGQLRRAATCLNVRGFTGAVIALHHDAAVVFEPREDRERGVAVEDIGRIEIGHARVGLAERRDHHVDIDPEHLARADLDIGGGEQGRTMMVGEAVGDIGHDTAFKFLIPFSLDGRRIRSLAAKRLGAVG